MKYVKSPVLGILFLAGVPGLIMAACGDDGAATSQSSTSSGSSVSSSASGSEGGSGAAGGGGNHTGGEGGGGGTGGTVETAGKCGRLCSVAADCCPEGQSGCPGDRYPNNFTCEGGICKSPRCAVKEDCTAGGMLPNDDCVLIQSQRSCARPCTADADCSGDATCSGSDDAGNALCHTEAAVFHCDEDLDCRGFGKCNAAGDGCYCDQSSDCSDSYSNACLL